LKAERGSAKGLRQFLDEKSYKPTYEPFKLGTLLADQRTVKK